MNKLLKENNLKQLCILKNILNCKLKRPAYKKITLLIKGKIQSTIDHVIIEDNNNNKVTVTDHKELYKVLMEEIKTLQSDKKHTICYSPIIQPTSPLQSNKPIANKVLHSNLTDFHDHDTTIQEVLSQLALLSSM